MGDSTALEWLLESEEPWTRYRTLRDLLGRTDDDGEVRAARAAMLAHPQVQALIEQARAWPARAIGRHNDASHPIHALSTLADFGLRADDPGVDAAAEAVLARQSPAGPFLSLLNVGAAYGGNGQDTLGWMACDAPTLLYALLAFGLGNDSRVMRAVEHLASLVAENGWRCCTAPELGGFRGPGRRLDPCPIANLVAVKALSLAGCEQATRASRIGCEMLLGHWARRTEVKYYLFGVGSDFRKLKYPFVWYDLLHVLDVLTRFASLRGDPRQQDMVAALAAQADVAGRYTAGSMFQAWKGWSFADKKRASPWLTFLALRIQARVPVIA